MLLTQSLETCHTQTRKEEVRGSKVENGSPYPLIAEAFTYAKVKFGCVRSLPWAMELTACIEWLPTTEAC